MYLTEAARSLYATKQRTILALVGIVIGIGSVIALVSIGNIVSEEAAKEFRALGTDVITIAMRSPDKEDMRKPRLYRQIAKVLSCVDSIAPHSKIYLDIDNENEDELVLIGSDQGFYDFARFQLSAGRFVNSLDAERPYAVLGAEVAQVLNLSGTPDQLIGQEIEIKGQMVTIIGVLKPFMPLTAVDIEPDISLFMPLKWLLALDSSRQISSSVARTQAQTDTAVCAEKVEQYFKRRIPGVQTEVTTAKELIANMRKQADMLSVLLTAIGSISLVVGGVGIMNIMLVSVSERKQEIGIRRALGAKRKDIRYQFLTESLLLSLLGGFLGVALSVITTYYVAQYNAWEFFVSWQAVFFGAGISAGIGVFFGFIPAHQAAKLDPIQALRGE